MSHLASPSVCFCWERWMMERNRGAASPWARQSWAKEGKKTRNRQMRARLQRRWCRLLHFFFFILFFFRPSTGLFCCGLADRVLASVATIHLAIHASQFHAIKTHSERCLTWTTLPGYVLICAPIK
ncbi:hypothetical protein BB8028_0002g04050 [Beauveria bassiana]|uniref:Uncharacterized protein n=1 Tax=Beauveria bassiana TaxID=176275 RepID=A0A2S7Y1T9_BEABA|nr:hypothetical protein BB8028_0002g04050 [Beauveria bassiana]